MAWDSAMIAEQRKLLSAYALKSKRELLRTMEVLRNFRRRARELAARPDETEKKRLLEKVAKLGLLKKGSGLDDVLALTVKDLLERRLQTMVFRKGSAKTMKQARQLIVHGKIEINGRKVDVPSYLVPLEEEGKINMKEEKVKDGQA